MKVVAAVCIPIVSEKISTDSPNKKPDITTTIEAVETGSNIRNSI